MGAPDNIDAYAPREIAKRVEAAGIAKANLPTLQTLMLGLLAGAFIAFGAILYTVVVTNSGLGFGPERLLGGVAFSLGLILVLVGGAELFTGNNLIVFAWVDKKIPLKALLRNWGLVYVGNLLGALATAVAIHLSGITAMADGAVQETLLRIADGKLSLSVDKAFIRAILCNVLVCLAVWLNFSARSVAGKVLVIVFPIAGFVALGFEHSIANMFFLPAGWLAGSDLADVSGVVLNIFVVTLGNIIGGGALVAWVYWIVYGRN
ncbi:MAG: formate transporter FocA [Rhodospirillaceae bacterium]|nr:formate transporter FocA [Rhodospirillaceae bacterium]